MSGPNEKKRASWHGASRVLELTPKQQSDQDLLSQSGMGGLFFTVGAIALSLSEPLIWQHKLLAMAFLAMLAVMMAVRLYYYFTLPPMTGFILPKAYYVCLLGNAAVWGIYSVWIISLPKDLNASSAVTITMSAGAACGGAVAIAMNLRLARALTLLYIVPLILYSFTQFERPQLPVLGLLLGIFLVYLNTLAGKQSAAYWKMVTSAEKLRKQTQELEEARNEALKASRMRSDFLAHISHEIRMPLNGIITVANDLIGSPLDARQLDKTNVILQSGKLAVSLINDVMDFSEIDNDAEPTGPLDVDLVALANEILNVLEPVARPQGNRIELIEKLEGKQWIKVDRLRLQQLMTNLLVNANRLAQGGYIELRLHHLPAARPEHELIRCEVYEQGTTLSAAEQKLLLEAFQEGGNKDPGARGAGLGLAICSRLIKLLGGRLGIRSQQQQDSCFWFEIPYVPGVPQVIIRTANSATNILPSSQMLLVEDDLMSQKIATAFLNKLQNTYQLATTGSQAVDLFTQIRPTHVLLDLGLPDIDGMEVTRRIRRLEQEQAWAPCIIIAMTAHGSGHLVDECLSSGMNDYLSKPLTLRNLQDMLDKWS